MFSDSSESGLDSPFGAQVAPCSFTDLLHTATAHWLQWYPASPLLFSQTACDVLSTHSNGSVHLGSDHFLFFQKYPPGFQQCVSCSKLCSLSNPWASSLALILISGGKTGLPSGPLEAFSPGLSLHLMGDLLPSVWSLHLFM